ncbi:DUF3488 and transglutaminase-like domain-containing protein [Nocardioides sp. NPDC092400]|uniref:transglutaminase family protein n=1 Tax=Nocardioides sp. NPDC092400 TaxID=3155196 RepID=UPI003438C57B
MSTRRANLRTTLAISLAAAATTWVATMSWRPFTEVPGRYLGPLAVIGLVVAATGALARWARVPRPLVVLLQVLTGGVVTSLSITGYPVPLGPGWVELDAALRGAVDSANQYAPPVPGDVPPVDPLLLAGGLGCFLLVDVLVSTLRRVSLAGLPLLTIYSVPVSVIGGELSGWVFVLTAAGFLLVLYLHESERVTRWGRALGDQHPLGFDVRTGRARRTAGAIGGVATALAVAVPLAVPTLDLRLVDFGAGPGGDDDITLTNPLADLKQDLVLGPDEPLLRLTTDDPDPSYLRTTALTSFNGETWSAGNRKVPEGNAADGALPPLQGVDPALGRRAYDYDVDVYETFKSDWLPTWTTSSRVQAVGDWRYDTETRDFIAADDDLDSAGLSYQMTGLELSYDATDMARAPAAGVSVPSTYTDVPADLPTEVRDLAVQVTREASTRYEKAVALQRWFRETGGFVYDTSADAGTSSGDLASFLSPEGRRGYCEQYAASMAVLARLVDIPARVAVGFLGPESVGRDTWEFSAHDLHAWPELFFAGSGWVRFEPTPAARTQGAPTWTRQDVQAPDPQVPDSSIGPAPRQADRAQEQRADATEEDQVDDAAADQDDRAWLLPVLGGGVGGGLLLALALVPRAVRTRRRDRRLSAGPEPAWDEVRDTALDLGLAWPYSRTPRQTGDWVAQHLGAPAGEHTAEPPPRGPSLAPDAVRALDRMVAALEVLRYSPRGADATGALRAEVETVTEALRDGAPRRARRLATWFPRSVLVRSTPATGSPGAGAGGARYGAVVDHVTS